MQPSSSQLLVLSNRAPYSVSRDASGQLRMSRSNSGVVNAVEPLMRTRSGVWVAEGPRLGQTLHEPDVLHIHNGAASYTVRRVALDAQDRRGYYEGFANSALWPLCHRTSVEPLFYATDFQAYERVNRVFADAVADEAREAAPSVFIQDYHFALAPRFIRKQLPLSRIATFWHIPWPRSERFEICPWSRCLLDGLLGSTVIGLQTAADRRNFLECAARVPQVDVHESEGALTYRGRRVHVGVYPASIAWSDEWTTGVPPIDDCRQQVRRELRLDSNVHLAVGVDRLDYTKGLEQKFLAVERLLERRPSLIGRFALLQIAEPTRTTVPVYRDVRMRVLQTAERINERFGGSTPGPIIVTEAQHSPTALARYFRAADVCYVGSLHDGMNLVSKEFVCSRDDLQGVLVLSAFAGAAAELIDAIQVNPYDVDACAAAVAHALAMPPNEQMARMRQLRKVVASADAVAWGARIVGDLAGDHARPLVRRHSSVTAAMAVAR